MHPKRCTAEGGLSWPLVSVAARSARWRHVSIPEAGTQIHMGLQRGVGTTRSVAGRTAFRTRDKPRIKQGWRGWMKPQWPLTTRQGSSTQTASRCHCQGPLTRGTWQTLGPFADAKRRRHGVEPRVPSRGQHLFAASGYSSSRASGRSAAAMAASISAAEMPLSLAAWTECSISSSVAKPRCCSTTLR